MPKIWPIVNPSDLARGGIASDNVAKMPGTSIAARDEMRMCAPTATARFGAAREERSNRPAIALRRPRPTRRTQARVAEHQAIRERDADTKTRRAGRARRSRGDEPALRLVESERLLVEE